MLLATRCAARSGLRRPLSALPRPQIPDDERPGYVVPVQHCAERSELTLYIKGFLAPKENADSYERWLLGHNKLCERLQWGAAAHGYCWESGTVQNIGPWGRFPTLVPFPTTLATQALRLARGARLLSLPAFLGWTAVETVATTTARAVVQYWEAERNAAAHASHLAEDLRALRARHEYLRVVAHSLGARFALAAVAELDADALPDELHLCAPACDAAALDAPPALPARTAVYWTERDAVLAGVFTAISGRAALGCAPYPGGLRRGVRCEDVSQHFDVLVHSEYRNQFHRMAVGWDD